MGIYLFCERVVVSHIRKYFRKIRLHMGEAPVTPAFARSLRQDDADAWKSAVRQLVRPEEYPACARISARIEETPETAR